MYKVITLFCFSLIPSISNAVLIDYANMDYKIDPDGVISYRLDVLRKILSNELTPNVSQAPTQSSVEKMPFGDCQNKIKVIADRNDNFAIKGSSFDYLVAYKFYYDNKLEIIACREGDTITKSIYRYQPGLRSIVR